LADSESFFKFRKKTSVMYDRWMFTTQIAMQLW
jgi:hypothetical protein